MVPDVRRALDPTSARTLLATVRGAFVASEERQVFPEWLLRSMVLLLSEHDVDLACEELDANLRTSARERWQRRPGSEVELLWDPEALATSPCRVAFAWLVHWAETAPKRRDREKAQRALATATRSVAEGERPFAALRRFGLDDGGTRRFRAEPTTDGAEPELAELVVHVRNGGAIEVMGPGGVAVLRLPGDELGKRVKSHVAALEEALLDARRTLAEAYADKLIVEARFVRQFLLGHPLWHPIAQGCVVRREGAPHTLRVFDESLAELPDAERLRFVLSQVEG
jgi:hypothetical protein